MCLNYFDPYPTGSPHPPIPVTAAADVGFDTDSAYGSCDAMSDIAGYNFVRWMHTTDGEIDFVFHICPFG